MWNSGSSYARCSALLGRKRVALKPRGGRETRLRRADLGKLRPYSLLERLDLLDALRDRAPPSGADDPLVRLLRFSV